MEGIAWANLCLLERSCRKLKDGACAKAARHAPWWNAASHFSDNIPAIEEDEIDSKFHAEGMHRLARHNPQAFAFAQPASSEQASRAGRPAVSYFYASQSAVCPKIAHLTPDTRIASLCHAIAG